MIEVTGVCSTENIELVNDLGADNVVDYKKIDICKTNEKFDIIFDTVGKISKLKVKNILNKDGRFISTHSSPVKEKTEHLVMLSEMINAGKVKPIIDKIFSLKDIRKAHEYVETGRKKGNVVIEIKPTA